MVGRSLLTGTVEDKLELQLTLSERKGTSSNLPEPDKSKNNENNNEREPVELSLSPNEIPLSLTFESVDTNNDGLHVSRLGEDSEEPTHLKPLDELKTADTFEPLEPGKTRALLHDQWILALYISVFGIFGTILRAYMDNFFGLDCENAGNSESSGLHICVTASGKTSQTGGALFTDLPANMLGSFVMGLLSPVVTDHPLVWFRADHPLQHHPAFHTALKVGFCGCLTTFASWNTQMVVMLVGTDTVLGSQVAAALFGYIIGTCVAVSCFVCGRHVYDIWRTIHALPTLECTDGAGENAPMNDVERGDEPVFVNTKPNARSRLVEFVQFMIGINVAPFALLAGLTAGFVVGDVVYGSLFYRKMWVCEILSIFGAIFRWQLSKFNTRPGPWKRLEWIPWGTLMANLIAVIVSFIAEGLKDNDSLMGASDYSWILSAIQSGFSGSLSTVSTFVKEMVDMKTPTQTYAYGFGSLVAAMLLGLLIYAPIVRA